MQIDPVSNYKEREKFSEPKLQPSNYETRLWYTKIEKSLDRATRHKLTLQRGRALKRISFDVRDNSNSVYHRASNGIYLLKLQRTRANVFRRPRVGASTRHYGLRLASPKVTNSNSSCAVCTDAGDCHEFMNHSHRFRCTPGRHPTLRSSLFRFEWISLSIIIPDNQPVFSFLFFFIATGPPTHSFNLKFETLAIFICVSQLLIIFEDRYA